MVAERCGSSRRKSKSKGHLTAAGVLAKKEQAKDQLSAAVRGRERERVRGWF